MIIPVSSNQSCSESTSWIHAWSGVADDSEMSQSNSESNSQWSHEAWIRLVFISDAKDDQHKNESEEEFKSNSLECTDAFAQRCVTETSSSEIFTSLHELVKASNTSRSSSALCNDVENRADNWDFASCQKANSDSWVNVTSRNMSNCLNANKKTSCD